METYRENTESYPAVFDRYEFNKDYKRIIVKHIRNDRFYKDQGYIDAMQVPNLIGNLIYLQLLEINCKTIIGNEIRNPLVTNIKRKQNG